MYYDSKIVNQELVVRLYAVRECKTMQGRGTKLFCGTYCVVTMSVAPWRIFGRFASAFFGAVRVCREELAVGVFILEAWAYAWHETEPATSQHAGRHTVVARVDYF